MANPKYTTRTIPRISLHDFESRVDEITKELIHAAETDGFFCLTHHGISTEAIENVYHSLLYLSSIYPQFNQEKEIFQRNPLFHQLRNKLTLII
jgi:isopenicillin N synthase-like dioxygenase